MKIFSALVVAAFMTLGMAEEGPDASYDMEVAEDISEETHDEMYDEMYDEISDEADEFNPFEIDEISDEADEFNRQLPYRKPCCRPCGRGPYYGKRGGKRGPNCRYCPCPKPPPPPPCNSRIGDTVYLDVNGDEIQNFNEPGIGGVTLTLYRMSGRNTDEDDYYNGRAVATTITDGSGYYIFDDLCRGRYCVRVTDNNDELDGLSATGPAVSVSCTYVNGNDEDLDQDFGYDCDSRVGDTVYYDSNADGIQGPGEPGIGGVTLELFSNSYYGNNGGNNYYRDGRYNYDYNYYYGGYYSGMNGYLAYNNAYMNAYYYNSGGVIAVTMTDNSGYYIFEKLCEGSYCIRVTDANDQLDGLTATGPAVSISCFYLEAGANRLDQDFGYYKKPCCPCNPPYNNWNNWNGQCVDCGCGKRGKRGPVPGKRGPVPGKRGPYSPSSPYSPYSPYGKRGPYSPYSPYGKRGPAPYSPYSPYSPGKGKGYPQLPCCPENPVGNWYYPCRQCPRPGKGKGYAPWN